MLTLSEARDALHKSIDVTNPTEAPTAYYALYHDSKRSVLHVRTDAQGHAVGFVGRFQTGIDLFRPLVCMRCWQPDLAADLLSEALVPGRPYLLFSNVNQLPMVGGSMQVSNERILQIFALDSSRFKSVMNVLVVHKVSENGLPRVEINSNGLTAMAGLNWQSPGFAEIYVHADPEVRQRGWGAAVVASICDRVLASGRVPLYLVEPSNEASVRLAKGLGFVDTGARQVFADTVYLGHPNKGARN
ncbi:MAG: GNAT family N-acetyltransferase [Anaerolineae bacterium]|nr:GNAT family N-acetyltransferase [Anaerolineae bacterium]